MDGREGSDRVAEAATAIGQGFDCHVEWLHVRNADADSRTIAAASMGAAAIWEPILVSGDRSRRERTERVRALFDARFGKGGAGIPWEESPPAGRFTASYREVEGFEPDVVEVEGRLADLIVMGRPGQGGRGSLSSVLHAAILGSGRPVLALPSEGGVDLGGIASIAWDGSKEAARATTAALPLLERCRRVLVMTGVVDENVSPPSRLLRYLAAHGVRAETWAFIPRGGPVARSLLEQCEKARAGLLVMGAYGHGRLHELVLGGVTRDALRMAELPILVAH
jgi:nucleotide-binding universal stress UspA family protein